MLASDNSDVVLMLTNVPFQPLAHGALRVFFLCFVAVVVLPLGLMHSIEWRSLAFTKPGIIFRKRIFSRYPYVMWPGGFLLAAWYTCAVTALDYAKPGNFFGTSSSWHTICILTAASTFVYVHFFRRRSQLHREAASDSLSLLAYDIMLYFFLVYLVMRVGLTAWFASSPLQGVRPKFGMLVFGSAWLLLFYLDAVARGGFHKVLKQTFFIGPDDTWFEEHTINKVGTDAWRDNAPDEM